MYPIGSRLLTLDGSKFGNGIITGQILAGGEVFYEAETDVGNELTCLTRQEIDDHWSVDEENTDIARWYRERDKLRSRSSMAEHRSVEPEDVGSVPTVTATLSHPEGCLMQGRNKVQGQCDAVACNYPFCER